MERREFIALIGMATAAMPSPARANPAPSSDSMAGRLVGTWSYVSSVNTRKDGSTFDRWGANPKGVFMFDSRGNYSQIILGAESRVFGSKMFCAFGTYSVDEANKRLVTRIVSSSTNRMVGVDQSRDIVVLTASDFKYTNLVTSSGAIAEVLWKRIG